MKVLACIVLSLVVLQTYALPTFEQFAESRAVKPIKLNVKSIQPKDDKVENFRLALDDYFVRYQAFYDRSSAEMRRYRFVQVDLVSGVYNSLMRIFGEDIQAIVELSDEFNATITERQGELGADNQCLSAIVTSFDAVSVRVGSTVQSCATFANTTMSGILANVFYPTFAEIQGLLSLVPNIVTDALSRGNVLEDEEEILEFLASRYQVMELEWITAVSQLLRWESARVDIDGNFLVDETTICLAQGVIDFIVSVSGLQTQARQCQN